MNSKPKEYKLFVIGLPRTGTTTICEALEKLGYATVHFPFEVWETGDLSSLDKCEAFGDTPIFAMFEQLDQLYPGSKFIYTRRPVETWLKSMEWLLSEGPKIWPWKESYNRFFKEFFGSDKYSPCLYSAAFSRHEKRVVDYFKNRTADLLTLELPDDFRWEPLCKFLGCDMPTFAFPSSNSSRRADLMLRLSVTLYRISPRFSSLVQRIRASFK